MQVAEKLMLEINRTQPKEDEPRSYLGASVLGRSCARQLWYGFRWADTPEFSSRVLRLFSRGHREEKVFEEMLVRAGVQYWAHDPATGEQFRVTFPNKHLGGHTDGQGKGLPDLDPDTLFLTEFKTHSDKSFRDVVTRGVQKSKPEHYVQMQLYMQRLNIEWALYGAVNKNDDDLRFEIIVLVPEFAQHYIKRGDMIVNAPLPPVRISDNPGWYECKWCDYYRVCHAGKRLQENCRTCQHALPLVDGDWWCGQHDKRLQKSEQLAGCQDHVAITAGD